MPHENIQDMLVSCYRLSWTKFFIGLSPQSATAGTSSATARNVSKSTRLLTSSVLGSNVLKPFGTATSITPACPARGMFFHLDAGRLNDVSLLRSIVLLLAQYRALALAIGYLAIIIAVPHIICGAGLATKIKVMLAA